MVNEFCGFRHGIIGTDKMPADTTLNNMKKADLIKLLHTAQHNYETLMWFYNNAVKVNMSQLNNNGWIPCSERLPVYLDNVLVCTENGGRTIAHLKHTPIEWRDMYMNKIDDVIAWKYLDSPYQPKGE